jgi:hypothetical protein
LIHPDVQTLGLLAGFMAITLAALAAIVTRARRQAAVPTLSQPKEPVGASRA